MNRAVARLLIAAACAFPAIAFAQGAVTNERVLAEEASGKNWFLKGGNFRGEHYSPLDEVNQQNVGQLGLAWSTELPMRDGAATTPIVVDGVVYIGGAYSMVTAIDARSGKTLWTYDPDMKSAFANSPMLSWISRANRGIAVWDGSVYVTTADCRLLALDAGSGEHQWTTQTCDTDAGYAISDSPYVGGGKIYVGNAGSESEKNNRGYVSAYDPKSGGVEHGPRIFEQPTCHHRPDVIGGISERESATSDKYFCLFYDAYLCRHTH